MWVPITVWVLIDARKRRNNLIGWSIGTLLFGPIVLPFYLAKRYLKPNEVREGGTAWNVLKYFTLFWTITMAASGIAGMIGAGSVISNSSNDFELAGAVVGTGLGMLGLFFLWFIVAFVALILGFFLKKWLNTKVSA